MLMSINFLVSMMSILISVAFYTILERKILSYMQIRKGPNKVGMLGILQPMSDALKLFNKNLMLQEMMNFSLIYFMPALSLFITLLLIPIITFNKFSMLDIKHSILMFFILSSMMVYFILLIGWAANSKYSYMGSIRSVAQMISYEISFFLVILFMIIISHSFSFSEIFKSQSFLYFFWGNMILFYIWMIICLAECNRSPFDFAEGESELVSGFNVEYMGGWFALIFLSEYMMMIMLSMISSIIFFSSLNLMTPFFMLLFITMTLLWIRSTTPRFRYDMLMNLNWKIFLPTSLFIIPMSMITMFMYF